MQGGWRNSTRLPRRAVFTTKYDGTVRCSEADHQWIDMSMGWLTAKVTHQKRWCGMGESGSLKTLASNHRSHPTSTGHTAVGENHHLVYKVAL